MKVTFLHDWRTKPVNVFDKFYLKEDEKGFAAYDKEDTKVGYLSNNQMTLLPGTDLSDIFAQDIRDRGANIILTSKTTVKTTKNEVPAYTAELFIQYAHKDEEPTKVEVLIEGSSVRHAKKAEVVTAITNQQDVILHLELCDDTVFVRQPGCNGTAGAVSTKKTSKDLMDQLKSSLATCCSITAKPTGVVERKASSVNYYVELSIESRPISTFSEQLARLTAECICTEKDAVAKIEFMTTSGFSTEMIQAVLAKNKWVDMQDRHTIPNPVVRYRQEEGSNLLRTVGYMLTGRNLRFFGPKGGGKNTLIETALWLLGRPMYRMSVSGDIDKFDVIGGPTLTSGETKVEISDMLKAAVKGGTVILDEANAARAEVLEIIHSLTDSARAVQVPGYGLVSLHEDAVICITMNEGYVGCGEMNAATIDRFVPIEVNPENNIKNLLQSMVPTAKNEHIDLCCKVHGAILNGIKQGMYSPDAISIRGFKDALMTVAFVPLAQGLVDNIANKSQDELERESLRNCINDFAGNIY